MAKKTYHLTVIGEPVPWTVYTKRGEPPPGFQRMQVYQELIRAEIINRRLPKLKGPVKLTFLFDRSTPEEHIADSQWLEKAIITRGKGDLSDYIKAAEDALKGLLFKDDSQVVAIEATKSYSGEKEGITFITIEALD